MFTDGVTLVTAGTGVSVAATDTLDSSITGSQTGITVIHASAESITVSPAGLTTITAGTLAYTAAAIDAYNNNWDVTGSVTWSINIGAGGSWVQSTGTYTSEKAGSWTVTADDGAGHTDVASLTVDPNAATHFVVSGFPSLLLLELMALLRLQPMMRMVMWRRVMRVLLRLLQVIVKRFCP